MSAKLQSIQKQNDSILFSLLSRKIDWPTDVDPIVVSLIDALL